MRKWLFRTAGVMALVGMINVTGIWESDKFWVFAILYIIDQIATRMES